MTSDKTRLRLSERTAAGLLAALWLCGGVAGIIIAIRERPAVVLLGVAAIWYGLIWLRVAWEGRQLTWPDGLIPWRRRRSKK